MSTIQRQSVNDKWREYLETGGGLDAVPENELADLLADVPVSQRPEVAIPDGFLKLPIPLFKEHGKNSLAISALWCLPEFRESGITTALHARIARLGVQPQTTFSRRLRKLASVVRCEQNRIVANDHTQLQRLFRDGSFRARQPGSTQYLELQKYVLHYANLGGSLADAILVAYVRLHTKHNSDCETAWIVRTLRQIVDELGGSERTWLRAMRRTHYIHSELKIERHLINGASDQYSLSMGEHADPWDYREFKKWRNISENRNEKRGRQKMDRASTREPDMNDPMFNW